MFREIKRYLDEAHKEYEYDGYDFDDIRRRIIDDYDYGDIERKIIDDYDEIKRSYYDKLRKKDDQEKQKKEELAKKIASCLSLLSKLPKDFEKYSFDINIFSQENIINNITVEDNTLFCTILFKTKLVASLRFDLSDNSIKIVYSDFWKDLVKGTSKVDYKSHNKPEDFQFIIDFLEEQRFTAMEFLM